MKTFSTTLLFLVLAVFLCSPIASALPVSFGDNNIFWLGLGNGSGDDLDDSIGIPEFTGGTAYVEDGYLLTLLEIYNSTDNSPYWWALSPGDLFINTGNDQYWDYVVDLATWLEPGPSNSDPAAGNYDIYDISSVNLGLNTSGYILSGTDNADGWSGWLLRDNHPVAYDVSGGGSYYGNADFSGWDNNSPADIYSLDFSGLIGGGLDVGASFTIGWTQNCANDVIYETISSSPVPEPATMLLFGCGLIGLAVVGRKKFQ